MSRAYIISGTTHIFSSSTARVSINLKTVAKVMQKNNIITFYYLTNNSFIFSNNMLNEDIEFNTEKEAQEQFNEITKLM